MNRQPYIIGMLALVLIALVTVPTLQTIPNGSQHYYMIDAGETQIVLNTWGTLHATGYPLYVMTGNSLTAWFRALGAAPAAAPSLVSFAWGMVALALIFALMRRIARNDWIAAGVTIVFALTRTAWIHLVIPEIYSFTLVFLALLLLVGLDSGRADGRSSGSPLPMRRVFWLALIGGVAVAHHRAVALAAPALIVAAWGALFSRSVSLWRAGLRLLICVALALIGFLPYVYLPLRAHGGAAWVYGDPGTLSGFLDQFLGREASRFIGVPSTWDALRANFELVTNVLIIDVSLVGIALGIIGLLVGIRARDTRRAAILLALVGGAAFAFHVFYYTDVLSALILMVTLSLAGGWALLAFHLTPRPSRTGGHIWLVPDSPHPEVGRGGADAERTDFAAAINTRRTFPVSTWRGVRLFFAVSAAIASIALYAQNQPFIAALTRDPAGLDAITLARSVPPDATLMLPWGVHHFAVGFARDVTGEIGGFDLVDHNADFSTNGARPIVTFDYTRFQHGRDWWMARIGDAFHVRAVAPHLIQVNAPVRTVDPAGLDADITVVDARIACDAATIQLQIDWAARTTPAESLRVFVHLLNADGALIDQADQETPVYGWSATNDWRPGVVVEDAYGVRRLPDAARIRYGLYRLVGAGFENMIERELLVECGGDVDE